mmetsp:Transcript_50707/g.162324  ORF Transcript_50707/g.162324 Transcript_50707/m.162324 type:complete len:200 (-) Transcript_50707:85-684(-)
MRRITHTSGDPIHRIVEKSAVLGGKKAMPHASTHLEQALHHPHFRPRRARPVERKLTIEVHNRSPLDIRLQECDDSHLIALAPRGVVQWQAPVIVHFGRRVREKLKQPQHHGDGGAGHCREVEGEALVLVRVARPRGLVAEHAHHLVVGRAHLEGLQHVAGLQFGHDAGALDYRQASVAPFPPVLGSAAPATVYREEHV